MAAVEWAVDVECAAIINVESAAIIDVEHVAVEVECAVVDVECAALTDVECDAVIDVECASVLKDDGVFDVDIDSFNIHNVFDAGFAKLAVNNLFAIRAVGSAFNGGFNGGCTGAVGFYGLSNQSCNYDLASCCVNFTAAF